VGLALWAYLTPEQASEMGKSGKIKPEDWRHGTDVLQVVKDQQAGKKVKLTEPDIKEGEVELWLVDFVVPFATPENKMAQACMVDLIRGPLKGKRLKMHKTDAKTGEKTVIELGGE
jgi:hemolysin-activating ACP:hemolysin acyltransferase